jgi:hypothetical protein
MGNLPSTVQAFDHEWAYHVLPDGRGVRFSFCEQTHVYRVEDPFNKRCFDVPSVTGILERAGLCENYSQVPAGVLERKRIIGAYCAKAIHLWQRRELDLDSLDSQVAPYFQGYLAFLKDSGFEVKYTERRVVGFWNGLWWAGTLDVEGDWQREPWVVDVKCTAELYPWHPFQTAGYALCLPKPPRPPFRYKRGTLQLRPDGSYARPKEHKVGADEETFLAALRLEWERRRRGIRQ